MIQRESRHLRVQLKDGKTLDETTPVFERLMLEVRDIRRLGRRIMIQDSTMARITESADVLRQIAEYYDPSAFEKGSAPPLAQP